MNKHESENLEHVSQVVSAMTKQLFELCVMLEHMPIPTLERAQIALGFAESKAALWGLQDALHDGARKIRAEEEVLNAPAR